MNKIEHEITIQSNAPAIYQALTTLKGLESWHSAHIAGDFNLNGQFTITHEKHPSFSWKIIGLDPNQRVKWECVKGPGNAPGTRVAFNLATKKDGRVAVECIHDGWPDTNGNFTKCNTLWGMLLDHLKQFVETDKPKPTFN
jgi:uncharacterized protein YndB with AHSA1/START domain